MIITLKWENEEVQLTINPELKVGALLQEECKQFFGFAWVLANKAQAEKKTLEEYLQKLEAEGSWAKFPGGIQDRLGISFEIATASASKAKEGEAQPDPSKFFVLDSEKMRVLTVTTKGCKTILDSRKKLTEYAVSSKPVITIEIVDRPRTIRLRCEPNDSHVLICTDTITGKDHQIRVESPETFSLEDVKAQLRTCLHGLGPTDELDIEIPGINCEEEGAEEEEEEERVQAQLSDNNSLLGLNDEEDPTVLELGSFEIKAGYAGDSRPRVVEPAVLGKRKKTLGVFVMLGASSGPESSVCSEAMKSTFTCTYVMAGPSVNWEGVERIWSHIFYTKLSQRPEFCPVLVTIPIMSSTKFREDILNLIFHELGSRAAYLAVASIMPLRAKGIATGVVVDSGYNCTYVTPVIFNQYVPGMVQRLVSHLNSEDGVGGRYFTELIIDAMRKQGHNNCGETDDARKKLFAQNILQSHCQVALDTEKPPRSDVTIEVPESSTITDFELEDTVWEVPEYFFQARTASKQANVGGLDSAVICAVRGCDPDVRRDLYSNIVLAGGCSRMKGLKERLKKELAGRAPKASIIIEDSEKYAHFHGASKLAQEMTADSWISQQEYGERGPGILRIKCPEM